jgi:hypothetical protein
VVYAQLAGGTAQQTGQTEEPTWFVTLLILGLAVSSLAFGVGYAALERQWRRAQVEQRTR